MKKPIWCNSPAHHRLLMRSALICSIALSSFTATRSFAQADAGSLQTVNGKIVYIVDGKEKMISRNDADTLAIMTEEQVIYLERKAAPAGSAQAYETKIISYNIRNGKRKELVAAGKAADFDYKIQNEIVSLCYDKSSNRLYFSTVAAYGGKVTQYVTWCYDLAKGTASSFKDGKVLQTDNNGKITVLMNGMDLDGKYTQSAVFSTEGNLVSIRNKEHY